jgi:Fic family protein
MSVRVGHHMRDWIIFFLHGVCETAKQSAAVFKSILVMKERIEREALPRFGSRRHVPASALLRRLYGRPVIDVKTTAAELNTTTNTATAIIMDFVTNGILVEITGQRRNRLFIFREYIDLFKKSAQSL